MIANVICILLICAGVLFSLKAIFGARRKAKKSGIPSGCCGCAAFKSGNCPSHKSCGK